MSSADETHLLSSYREVATVTNSIKAVSKLSPEEITKAVIRWLQAKANWLLIFDNLDDIRIIRPYLPPLHRSGHVLITTRNKNCDGIPAEGLEIIPMNSTESVSLLLTLSKFQDDPKEEVTLEAGKIVVELGHLPLAIEQAAAYIRSSQDIFEYLSAYHQNRKELLHDKPQGNYPYEESVATTWKMSFHRLQTTNPNSIKLIEVLAFLSPNSIPIDFLKAGKTGLWPDLEVILQNDFFLRQSLHGLESYSLIRVWDEGRKITIHRLVQSVIKDNLEMYALSFLRAQVIQLALSAFPNTVEGTSREICRAYRSQVVAILDNSEDNHKDLDPIGGSALAWKSLAGRMAFYLNEDGYSSEAERFYTQCLEIGDRILGCEHPDTLWSMNNLVASYSSLGRAEQAAKLLQETLEIRKRVLGPEHPDTLWSMNGLASSYWSLGQAEQAAKLDEETLEIRKRVLGPEHPDTLRSMNGLAASYSSLGRAEQAAKLCEETLEIQNRVLGHEHPDTLRSMNNLAASYRSLGRAEQAAKLHEETLEIQKRVLGPEHPDTLHSMNGLAASYRSLGRAEQAAKLVEETLAIRKRVLGPEHPDTLESMNDLVASYRSLGRAEQAAQLDEERLDRTPR